MGSLKDSFTCLKEINFILFLMEIVFNVPTDFTPVRIQEK